MTTVSRLSISTLVGYFVLYLILHIGLGFVLKQYEEKLEKNPNDKDIKFNVKLFSHGFNWFPAAYLVWVIILMLY